MVIKLIILVVLSVLVLSVYLALANISPEEKQLDDLDQEEWAKKWGAK